MKTNTFIGMLVIFISAQSFGQLADLKAQEEKMNEYKTFHESHVTNTGSRIERDAHKVKETWISANGDKNTIEKNTDTSEVKTIIEHPDGSVEVNGKEVEHPRNDKSTQADKPSHEVHEAKEHNNAEPHVAEQEAHESREHEFHDHKN